MPLGKSAKIAAILSLVVIIAASFSAGRDATRYTLITLSVIGIFLWSKLGAASGLRLVCIAPISFCLNVAAFNVVLLVRFPLSQLLMTRWVQVIELHGLILTISSALLAIGYIGGRVRLKMRNHESVGK